MTDTRVRIMIYEFVIYFKDSKKGEPKMNVFGKLFASQSIISWILQIIFIGLAWKVADHTIPNNLITIIGGTVLMLLIYVSLARDSQKKISDK